jgi:hypothetical protein
MHWIYVHAGLSSPNSPWYLFWSGIGADWTRLLALGGVLHLSRSIHQHRRAVLSQAPSENSPDAE